MDEKHAFKGLQENGSTPYPEKEVGQTSYKAIETQKDVQECRQTSTSVLHVW